MGGFGLLPLSKTMTGRIEEMRQKMKEKEEARARALGLEKDKCVLGTSTQQLGLGHLDPKLERGQLRKEIDTLMKSVEKAVANKELNAKERIERIDDYKNQINDKKERIYQIKRETRETIEATKPITPRELAPVKAPKGGKPMPAPNAAVPRGGKDWQRNTEPLKTRV